MLLSFVVFVATAFGAIQATSVSPVYAQQGQNGGTQTLEIGQYFRPSGDQVSGVPKSPALYHRSPCPGLNTLANHGYIPRDGHNLTPQLLRDAIMKVYNADLSVVLFQTANSPARLTLADLGKHNFIEHDSSLVHADSYYGQDPAQVDSGLANDLFGRAVNGYLGIQEMGMALRDRLAWCKQKPPKCDFGGFQDLITFRESAVFLQVFGGKRNAMISVQHAYSFLVLEQFPSDWQRPATPVTMKDLNTVETQIRRIARA